MVSKNKQSSSRAKVKCLSSLITLFSIVVLLCLILVSVKFVQSEQEINQKRIQWSMPSYRSAMDKFKQRFQETYDSVRVRAFDRFKQLYNRTYSREEIQRRAKIFLDRFKTIADWNQDFANGKVSFSLKANHLADRSDEELNKLNGLEVPQTLKARLPTSYWESDRGLPDSVDLRKTGCITEVRNQEDCGSCYAFSTADLIGAARCLETEPRYRYIYKAPRSPQQIMDCGISNPRIHGCNGGWPLNVLEHVEEKGYLATESQYPYKARLQSCKMNSGYYAGHIKYRQLESENSFKKHIAHHGPVVAAMKATSYFSLYDKGVFDDRSCGYQRANHGVLVIGYGREQGKDYWLIKNSYGSDWGDNGYMKMIRGKESCRIGTIGWGIEVDNSTIY